MIGQYGIAESIRNGWALALTKVFFPGARLVRRPFYLRGGKRRLAYGKGFTTGYSCRFDLSGHGVSLRFGDNCKINDRVHISAYESVRIGDNVLMASNIFISDNSHGSYGKRWDSPCIAPDDRPIVTNPVVIGDNVWIGEGACVLPGVSIGDGCVVGSNAVVTRSIPSNCIVAGCPARILKRWSEQDGGWLPVGNTAPEGHSA